MSFDLMLKPGCGGCGSKNDLYGSNCKHFTLCPACGKSIAEKRGKCYECGSPLTRLIRDDDDEEEDSDEKESKLSKSGKEVKKLLGRSNGLNDSGRDEDEKRNDEEDDDEDEDRPCPVLAPKSKGLKEERNDNSPVKANAGGSSRGTPASKSTKGKRKHGDETKPASGAASKKIKPESDVKPNIKEEATKNAAGVQKLHLHRLARLVHQLLKGL